MKEHLIAKFRQMNIQESIISAFNQIERKNFIPKEYQNQAYEDIALKIGFSSTISQPSTVVLMLSWLDIKKKNKVLEIGTGSGYNAALISKLAKKVFTIETVPELVKIARENLKDISNVKIIEGDGKEGLEKESPFDRIILTAACKEVPKKLIEQLKNNGKLIAPVGTDSQEMILFEKRNGKITTKSFGNFLFVPLK